MIEFDISENGIEKVKKLAEHNKVEVSFFKADLFDDCPDKEYDIIFSSGVFHFISQTKWKELCDNLKVHTVDNGINAINVFVKKPFITCASDNTRAEERRFDCNSGGIPHKYCMNTLIAQKIEGDSGNEIE